jgi:hypothetical protein
MTNMDDNTKWCLELGGLRGFSARKAFPNLEKYFDFNSRLWLACCKTASSLRDLEADGKDEKEIEDIFLWKGTVNHLTWKTLKTSLAIQNLLEQGFLEDAYILIRSILESLITLEYISRDVHKRIRQFHEYSFVFKHRWREAHNDIHEKDVASAADPEKMKTIERHEEEYQRVKKYYKSESSWSNQPIRNMAKEVDLESTYRIIYTILCQFSHNTVNTENSIIKDGDEGGFKIIIAPGDEDEQLFKTAIHLTASYTMMVTQLFHRVFKTEFETELDGLFEEFMTIDGKSVGQPLNP